MAIDSIPKAVHVYILTLTMVTLMQTNKQTKYDGRIDPLISPLHNADKPQAGHPIG